LAPGGAQEVYGIIPDLSTFGKIIGGGMPVGAYGGKAEIMDQISPAGPVYQAGTLSGNPVAMAAGLAMLKTLKENPQFYDKLNNTTEVLSSKIGAILSKNNIAHQINRIGSMFSIFFTEEPVVDFNSATKSNKDIFADFFNTLLKNGVYYPPSPFEAVFISTAIESEQIDHILASVDIFSEKNH
ncbi:MAG: aminotransferase class III-fold pyridoxal phosphate-dependent enzyme, partial [Cyclobacteriaceae bacterium]|nr:aminotransferase class III-fold pyridoxal phosphate-dependent enzyme [Cyclobacteriaceae bacterium]